MKGTAWLNRMDYASVTVVCMLLIITKFRASESEGSHDVYPELAEYALKFNNHSVPLYFGLMLSLSGDAQSSGARAGVQAALDEINSRDDFLPGYSLHYSLTDSKVLQLVAIRSLSISYYTTLIPLYAVQ